MFGCCDLEPVAAYYERKTESILRRYQRIKVHFHAGFLDEPVNGETAGELRQKLHESQERMLRDASSAWNLNGIVFAQVLDVGCGLGGPAIFCAEHSGSHVTAITIAPSHVSLVARFAHQLGLGSQIHPLLCDALDVSGSERFDAIIAIDSSCHLDRRLWFRRVAQLLRPGGRIFIADCFVDQEWCEAIDRHWCAQIGTVDEYLAAGREAGLRLERLEDVSRRVANFWASTVAVIRLEAEEVKEIRWELSNLQESLKMHSLMVQGLADGGLRHMLMSFAKKTV